MLSVIKHQIRASHVICPWTSGAKQRIDSMDWGLATTNDGLFHHTVGMVLDIMMWGLNS